MHSVQRSIPCGFPFCQRASLLIDRVFPEHIVMNFYTIEWSASLFGQPIPLAVQSVFPSFSERKFSEPHALFLKPSHKFTVRRNIFDAFLIAENEEPGHAL